MMRGLSMLLRVLVRCRAIDRVGGVAATEPRAQARAAGYETLMVPSAAMGRDIPVAFLAGGPHAVYLLDAFNAAPDVSNWVTAGNAMNTLAGKGISVVAPAGGAFSMYTNWEQDGSKQWDTFLSSELPDWLAANKGLAPGGHGVVGASQGGYAAMALAAFHPDRFGFAGSLSGLPVPVEHHHQRRDPGRPAAIRRRRRQRNVGRPAAGPVEVARPVGARRRCWRRTTPGSGSGARRTWMPVIAAAMIGQAGEAMGNSRMFYQQYRNVGGHNGHFDFPGGGDNGWGSWSGQLGAMSGDIVGAIR